MSCTDEVVSDSNQCQVFVEDDEDEDTVAAEEDLLVAEKTNEDLPNEVAGPADNVTRSGGSVKPPRWMSDYCT